MSTDRGNTWIYCPFPDDINGSGTILADRANPGLLYVAARRIMAPPPNFVGSALAVLKSTDGGVTWAVTTLTSPTAWSARTDCLVQDPADSRTLYAGGLTNDATGSSAWLFRTTDGGATWAQRPAPASWDVMFSTSRLRTLGLMGRPSRLSSPSSQGIPGAIRKGTRRRTRETD